MKKAPKLSEEAQYLVRSEQYADFTRWLYHCFHTGEKHCKASKRKIRKVCREVCGAIERGYAWEVQRVADVKRVVRLKYH